MWTKRSFHPYLNQQCSLDCRVFILQVCVNSIYKCKPHAQMWNLKPVALKSWEIWLTWHLPRGIILRYFKFRNWFGGKTLLWNQYDHLSLFHFRWFLSSKVPLLQGPNWDFFGEHLISLDANRVASQKLLESANFDIFPCFLSSLPPWQLVTMGTLDLDTCKTAHLTTCHYCGTFSQQFALPPCYFLPARKKSEITDPDPLQKVFQCLEAFLLVCWLRQGLKLFAFVR